MDTLAADNPARADDAPAPSLDAGRTSRMAATLLRKGIAPGSVREHASGRPRFAYMWLAIADSMDAITATVPAQRTAPALETASA